MLLSEREANQVDGIHELLMASLKLGRDGVNADLAFTDLTKKLTSKLLVALKFVCDDLQLPPIRDECSSKDNKIYWARALVNWVRHLSVNVFAHLTLLQ